MSLFNTVEAPLSITISIRDHEHFRRGGAYRDRFNGQYTRDAGWNYLRRPVETIRNAPDGRALDLADLAELVIFTANLRDWGVIYLDRVQLAGD